MPTEPLPSSPPLDYQPDTPRRRARRWIVRLTFPLLIGAFAIVIGWNWNAISNRASEIYWFNRCMNHVTPPGMVLVEADPVKAAALIKLNRDYFDRSTYVQSGYISAVPNGGPPDAEYVPFELRRLEPFLFPRRWDRDEAAVYVGKIQSPSGKKWLLIIRGSSTLIAQDLILSSFQLIEPPTVIHDLREIPTKAVIKKPMDPPIAVKLDVASLDPQDPSHIIIPFKAVPDLKNLPDNWVTRSGMFSIYLHNDETLSITELGK